MLIKLCLRGAHTCAQPLFRCCDLDINPMTSKLEGELDILKIYLHAENEVAIVYVKAFESPNRR